MSSLVVFSIFFFNDTATTEIYTLSLHDALPISRHHLLMPRALMLLKLLRRRSRLSSPLTPTTLPSWVTRRRSEEHTSELQSRQYLVCRLLLEKKNYNTTADPLHVRHMLYPSIST